MISSNFLRRAGTGRQQADNMKRLFKSLNKHLNFGIIAVLLASLVTSYAVFAQTVDCDYDFYSRNDIMFYDPCAVNVCSTEPTSGAAISKLRGANNGEKIYNFWVDTGLAPQQSAGVTGSMKHEGGFSPFRQEMSQSWPAGGWGIAQFTFGQRDAATAYVRGAVGESLFNQYYQNQYGGAVTESSGFIPDGVSVEVNDQFLLAELNYLLDHIKQLNPNSTRREFYQRDFGKTFEASMNLYDYLRSLPQPEDSAIAWTYLYEFPGDIKATSLERAESAKQLYALYNGGEGASSECSGGLATGGLNLEEAKAFMAVYKQIDSGDPNGDRQYLTGACNTLTDNCVTFASYFTKKYTTATFGSNNGAMVVNSTLALNPEMKSGTIPQPYSIFAIKEGRTMCDWGGYTAPCGHTGIVLGVDTANDKVIVGEAAWCNDSFTAAREYSLAEWSAGAYTYAYLQPYLKGDVK